ncbi:MAG TPA: Holliday junction resolvase RuvX [Cytophagaceae bacterium]
MPRIVAVDYGTKRVGIAVTDPLKIIATPLDTIHSKDVIQFLKNYHETEGIEAFVVGMPKTLNNEASENARHVRAFINALRKNFAQIPIHEVDERFTSSMALDAMIAGGMKKKDRQIKGNVDKISATIILQSFLQSSNI